MSNAKTDTAKKAQAAELANLPEACRVANAAMLSAAKSLQTASKKNADLTSALVQRAAEMEAALRAAELSPKLVGASLVADMVKKEIARKNGGWQDSYGQTVSTIKATLEAGLSLANCTTLRQVRELRNEAKAAKEEADKVKAAKEQAAKAGVTQAKLHSSHKDVADALAELTSVISEGFKLDPVATATFCGQLPSIVRGMMEEAAILPTSETADEGAEPQAAAAA